VAALELGGEESDIAFALVDLGRRKLGRHPVSRNALHRAARHRSCPLSGMASPRNESRRPDPAQRVVLLDIDGTLIASNDAHARAWVASLAEFGYTVTFEQVRPLIGMGGDKILPELVGLDPESREAKRMGERRGEIFRTSELPHLTATPGARDLLLRFRADDYELSVATSAKADDVKATLEQAGVADLIETATSSDDAERSKPDPDIVRAALRRSRRPASHAVMLGDTPYDIEAATRARVRIVALRCGGWWSDKALSGAAAIYDDPAALLARYDDSIFGARAWPRAEAAAD
jgi:phosphoglycolate phosphatase-like HAD superfamily hydrolase